MPISKIQANSLAANAVPVTGARNHIINGNMEINQRSQGTANLSGAGVWFADRFFSQVHGTSIVVSGSRSTDVPSGTKFKNSVKFSVTTAATGTDHYTRITHRVEGYGVKTLGMASSGNKLVLSFYVKSTTAGTHTVGMCNGYRAGTAYAQAGITHTYTINAANTWQRVEIPFDSYSTGGSADWKDDNNLGVEITFVAGQGATAHGAGSIISSHNTWEDFASSAFVNPKSTTDNNSWGTSTSDEFYITGVQLESGTSATDFENPVSYGDELQKCRRYFSRFNCDSTAAGVFSFAVWSATTKYGRFDFPTEMRTNPSLTVSNNSDFTVLIAGSTGSISGWTLNSGDTNYAELNVATSSLGSAGQAGWIRGTTGGYIDLDAEL